VSRHKFKVPKRNADLSLHETSNGHIIVPEGFDHSIAYWRGPLPKNKTPAQYDSEEDLMVLLDRLAACSHRNERIRCAVRAVYVAAHRDAALGAPMFKLQDNNSLNMKIRHFHNELELAVDRHCLGGIYRSKGAIELARSGGLSKKTVHDEHTIPVNIVAGMILTNIEKFTLPTLADFLLTETILTIVSEEEETTVLNLARAYSDDQVLQTWSDEHPCYHKGSSPGNLTSLPFLRYHKTDLKITSWLTGEDIVPDRFTLAQHKAAVRKHAMFRWETYFPETAVAA